jgi:preprotein translocase subunit SecG
VTIFLVVLHVMVCLVLVVVVLLQHGKGADIGAVFGGGASTTVFGSRGAGNFLTRLTTGAALTFMLTSLSLSYIANRRTSIFEEGAEPPAATAPAPEGAAQGAPGPAEAQAPEAAAPETGGFEEVKPPSTAEPEAKAPEAKAPETGAEAPATP